MEELFEKLGLDPDAPNEKAVEKVDELLFKIEDKNEIIEGFEKKVENLEDQLDDIADGVAEARVKDLVQKVQHETGRHVGSEHMETLQEKATRYLYASSEEEKESIWKDMKAHTIAYGAKVGVSEKVKSLRGDREDEDDSTSPQFKEAKQLVDSGDADTWEEAMQMVQENAKRKTDGE